MNKNFFKANRNELLQQESDTRLADDVMLTLKS